MGRQADAKRRRDDVERELGFLAGQRRYGFALVSEYFCDHYTCQYKSVRYIGR